MGGGEGSDINIFPRRSISLVRRNGCLPAPCGPQSPSGQKQIKAHTLQIGDLPQLARRREFSAALIEKSLSRLLPISLLPRFKRKSHPLRTLAGHLLPAPLSCSGKGPAGREWGRWTALFGEHHSSPPKLIALRTVNCQRRLIYKTDLPSGECNYARS